MRLLLAIVAVLLGSAVHAQLLTWTPDFPVEDNSSQTLVITVDASKGNKGLLNHTPVSDVYVHIGVITSLSSGPKDWKYIKFNQNFNQPNAQLQAISLGNNKWSFTISGSLKTYFGVPAGETIQKIAILFRSGNGQKKQTVTNSDNDMYVPVYTNALAVRLNQPIREPNYTPTVEQQYWTVGSTFPVQASTNKASTLKLYHNGQEIATASNAQAISGTVTVAAEGNQEIKVEANDGTTTQTDILTLFVAPATSPVVALPAGMRDGINYEAGNTAAVLVLHAPEKSKAYVIGDFNDWALNTQYIMNKTPDGQRFWIRIQNLNAATEYGFQYIVDDNIRIADPYTQKVLDPTHDASIPATAYPNRKPYPTGKTTGMVGVLNPSQMGYTWTTTNYTRPDKRGLVIYELLLRDFVAAHDWNTLRDTLNYLKRLGVNAIEVMPFNEFEGNLSWGYNPDFYFAPDKYYGTATSLKQFIDVCHANGIAVIMDIVLNHTYGPSPLALLYWDGANSRPAANNPWYNPVQPHAFGFGDDFNHDSPATKQFFNRVLQHWITEYKIDGYRIDFSKGLTQKASSSDATFSAYDASRIAIIEGYGNAVKAVDPGAYIILEHFADNAEEKELADKGFMLWANVWTQYQEASMGWLPNSNFDRGIHTVRNWTNPHLVTFMESHDEERVTYKNIKYGNASGSYNIKDTATALKRMELNAAFTFTIPGPKMIWQFGELGYDYSRCYQSTNGEGGDCNKKTDAKPILWDYKADPRRSRVYNVYSSLIQLRFHPWYREAFMSNRVEQSLAGGFKWIKINTDTSNMVVVGNFDVSTASGTVTFPSAGTWYDYLQNTTFTATGSSQNITLAPGEYHVYVNRNVNNVATTPVSNVSQSGTTLEAAVYPNPVRGAFAVAVNLPQSGATQVELMNVAGQRVAVLHSGFKPKGKQVFTFNRDDLRLASGSYFLKVIHRGSQKVIQVTL